MSFIINMCVFETFFFLSDSKFVTTLYNLRTALKLYCISIPESHPSFFFPLFPCPSDLIFSFLSLTLLISLYMYASHEYIDYIIIVMFAPYKYDIFIKDKYSRRDITE